MEEYASGGALEWGCREDRDNAGPLARRAGGGRRGTESSPWTRHDAAVSTATFEVKAVRDNEVEAGSAEAITFGDLACFGGGAYSEGCLRVVCERAASGTVGLCFVSGLLPKPTMLA